MAKISLFAIVCAAISLPLTGCGDLERTNNYDPVTGGGILRDQLVGSWSRDDLEQNETYFFRADNGAQLKQFFPGPDGGVVDRNAPFPETEVHRFEGTYKLVVDQLTITFTRAASNKPGVTIDPPSQSKVVEIGIRGRTLTMTERDGKRLYTRLD